jgi:hypothetical protein
MRPSDAYRAKARSSAAGEVLVAEFEDHPILLGVRLRKSETLDGSKWLGIVSVGGTRKPVPLGDVASSAGDDSIFVSVSQLKDGRHEFVRLSEAVAGAAPLALYPEADVKARFCPRLFYARAPLPVPSAAAASTWHYPDVAPHGIRTNYSVVPWLSLGKSRAMMLSDEETLCRDVPAEKIFESLTLIINCHEDRPGRQYRAGSPWPPRNSPPAVVAHAVHRWYSSDNGAVHGKIDAINEAMWAGIQEGTVAVHCLAGIHRAACIMACHFLYRYYVLGHADVPHDKADIYKKMMSVRPHVRPAYEDILNSYEKYLQRKTRR